MQHFGGSQVQETIIAEIQQWMNEHNPHARTSRWASERYQLEPAAIAFRLEAVQWEGTDAGRYNLPTNSEVALVMFSNDESAGQPRDIIIQYKGGQLKRLDKLSGMYFFHCATLQFMLKGRWMV